jgi:peptide/nickel transport system substrate-binding protein
VQFLVERLMSTIRVLFTFAAVASLFFGSCFQPTLGASPSIQRQMEIIEATIEGGSIPTVDPAALYDTASGELLMHVYDTLVFFDGEPLDRYLPQLATSWSFVENVPPILDPDTGLTFKWTYYFKIRTGVQWHNTAFGNLTPADVEYTVERGMVMEAGDNPQWMLYEPLLNGAAADYIDGVELNLSLTSDIVFAGTAIDHAIESNSTYVWFNLVFDGAYAPFMQILCQPWSSILCQAWCNSLGRVSWDGSWGDYTGWVAYHRPATPPLDNPTPAMMGTGPFAFGTIDNAMHYWDVNRFADYWRGWGSAPNYGVGWPAFGGSKPAGYIDRYKVTWAYDWNARKTKFLNGEVDFCSVPTQYKDSIIGQPNIRTVYPLPSLSAGVLHYQFDIRTTSPYGPIYEYGILNESGVPRDFFGNTSYGIYIRKAFSYCIDFQAYLDTWVLGEAIQPPTALIPTLPYYNASIPKYSLNLTKAAELFHMWPGLWDTGFTIRFLYNVGSLPRQQVWEQMSQAINSLNSKFHCSALGLDWASFLAASNNRWLPAFTVGWLADYPDAHNFVYPYYYSGGHYAARQGYSDPVMDDLIDQGIRTPDGPARGAIYSAVQQRAIDVCPSVGLSSAVGRHYEKSWVNGWYYNPADRGLHFYTLWKEYAVPGDVDGNSRVDMRDIAIAARAFGAAYGPPMSAKWNFWCDINNDRKIDIRDIATIARNFGKTR